MKLRKPKPDVNQRRRPNTTATPGVFSYYSQRSGTPAVKPESLGRNKEPVSIVKRTRLRLGYLPSYVALLALIVALVYSLWLQPVPRISVASAHGTVYRDSKLYQSEIEDIWKRSLLNQTKLTVNSRGLRTDILNHFNELADVQIELPLLGRRPAVTLTPGKPVLQLVSSNGVFYVNQSGGVMAKTTDVTQNQLPVLPLVRDEAGLQAEVGKPILPEPHVRFLVKLFAQLTEAKVAVQSITLPSTAANQADVRLSDKTYYVKFAIDSDPRQAVGAFLAARDKLAAEGKTPAEYIDVRVEEKVFYR